MYFKNRIVRKVWLARAPELFETYITENPNDANIISGPEYVSFRDDKKCPTCGTVATKQKQEFSISGPGRYVTRDGIIVEVWLRPLSDCWHVCKGGRVYNVWDNGKISTSPTFTDPDDVVKRIGDL